MQSVDCGWNGLQLNYDDRYCSQSPKCLQSHDCLFDDWIYKDFLQFKHH
jgi:hypothetical protein